MQWIEGFHAIQVIWLNVGIGQWRHTEIDERTLERRTARPTP